MTQNKALQAQAQATKESPAQKITQTLSLYNLDDEYFTKPLILLQQHYKLPVSELLDGVYARSMLATWASEVLENGKDDATRVSVLDAFEKLAQLKQDYTKFYNSLSSQKDKLKRSVHAFYKTLQKHDFKYSSGHDDKISSLSSGIFDCEPISDLFIQLSSSVGIQSIGSVFIFNNPNKLEKDYMPAVISQENKIQFVYAYNLLFNKKDPDPYYEKELIDLSIFSSNNIPKELTFEKFEVPPYEKRTLSPSQITFTLRQKYYAITELATYITNLDKSKPAQTLLNQGENKYYGRWREDPKDFSFFYALAKFYIQASSFSKNKEYTNTVKQRLTSLLILAKDIYGEQMIRQNFSSQKEFLNEIYSNSFLNSQAQY
jgi:hypothetical protein